VATPEGKVKDQIKKGVEDFVSPALPFHMWMTVPCGMGSSGIPDFLFNMNGRSMAIEAKAAGKELSDLQKAWRDDFIKAGGYYIRMRPKTQEKNDLQEVRHATCILLTWFWNEPERYKGLYATMEQFREALGK
jgi:VRR-NUC domain